MSEPVTLDNSSQTDAIATSISVAKKTTINTTIAIWLIFIYFLTVGVSILLLGSYQIQKRIEKFEVNNRSFSIARIDEMSTYRDNYESQSREIAAKITDLREEVAGIIAFLKENEPKYDEHAALFKRELADFEATFSAKFPDHIYRYREKKDHGLVTLTLKHLKEDIAAFTLEGELAVKLNQLGNIATRGLQAWNTISAIKKNRDRAYSEIETLVSVQAERDDAIRNGFWSDSDEFQDFSATDKASIQNTISEFSRLKELFLGVPYHLASIPSELMVLFLVLAMGALGSTIFITQIFFQKSDKELDVVFYISRPFFGATIALSIFVLAKAGVLFLTDTTGGDNPPALSPFFISFIAIISGLMSEQAIDTVREAGERWLQKKGRDDARWGVGLQKVLDEKGLQLENYAYASGEAMEIVETWFRLEDRVPLDAQRSLAIWLETKPHLLFTDIEPEKERDVAIKTPLEEEPPQPCY